MMSESDHFEASWNHIGLHWSKLPSWTRAVILTGKESQIVCLQNVARRRHEQKNAECLGNNEGMRVAWFGLLAALTSD